MEPTQKFRVWHHSLPEALPKDFGREEQEESFIFLPLFDGQCPQKGRRSGI